ELLHGIAPCSLGFLVTAHGFRRVSDTRAVDQDSLLPMSVAGSCKGPLDLFVARHVHFAEDAANLAGDLLPAASVPIENRDLCAAARESAGRCFSQSGGS